MRPLTDLFGASQFSTGLVVGIVALAIALPAALGLAALFPKRGHRPGVAGPAFAIGAVFALGGGFAGDTIFTVPSDVVTGLLLVWLAGTIAAWTPAPGVIGPLAAVPGAIVLAGANVGLDAAWVPVVIALGTIVIGATAADFDHRTGRFGLGPLLFLIAVGGIYVTVPDTELMRAVVGVSLPLVFLAWPYAAAQLGGGGAYAAVGLLLWIAPLEGLGRPGAIVGAVGAFGLLLGEPIGRLLGRELEGRTRLRRIPITRPRVMLVAAQIVVVFYATRVAGLAQSASTAFILMIPALVASVAFGVFFVIPERRRRHHRKGTSGVGSSSDSVARPRRRGESRRPRPLGPDDYV